MGSVEGLVAPVSQPECAPGSSAGVFLDRLTGQFTGGADGPLDVEGQIPLGIFIARRRLGQSDPISESIETLRKEFNRFVKQHIEEQQSLGFGQMGGNPVDCAPLAKKAWDTEEKLSVISDSLPAGSPLTLAQRGIILQVNAALQNFLVDLSSLTSGGEADQSDVRTVLKCCIALGQTLGELKQGLEAAKMQLQMAAASS